MLNRIIKEVTQITANKSVIKGNFTFNTIRIKPFHTETLNTNISSKTLRNTFPHKRISSRRNHDTRSFRAISKKGTRTSSKAHNNSSTFSSTIVNSLSNKNIIKFTKGSKNLTALNLFTRSSSILHTVNNKGMILQNTINIITKSQLIRKISSLSKNSLLTSFNIFNRIRSSFITPKMSRSNISPPLTSSKELRKHIKLLAKNHTLRYKLSSITIRAKGIIRVCTNLIINILMEGISYTVKGSSSKIVTTTSRFTRNSTRRSFITEPITLGISVIKIRSFIRRNNGEELTTNIIIEFLQISSRHNSKGYINMYCL